MKHGYNQLLAQFPDRIKVDGNIEYVENPYFSDRPIIKIDRENKTAVDTDVFEPEELP